MKKFIAIIMSILIVGCCLVTPASATNISKEKNNFITERVEDFVSSRKGEDFTIKAIKPFLDEEENVISYCYFLEPVGYVIIDTGAEVVEAAFDNTASYKALISQEGNIYYAGPLNYYTRNNSCYNNIMTKEAVPENAVAVSINEFTDTISTSVSYNAVNTNALSRGSITTDKLTGTLRRYSYNTGVICGSTAAAIMLMYYRDYRDSWVVPSWHDTSTGQSLIELIRPEINGDPPQGAFCSDVVRGLNFYFRWRGIADQYSATWSSGSVSATTYNAIRSLITANKPVEILINDHPTYGNHFVVAHGVEKEIHGSTYYYIYAGDGWGSNNVLISFRYLRQYAYIIG